MTFPTRLQAGDYRAFRTGAAVTLTAGGTMTLPAWGYTLLASR